MATGHYGIRGGIEGRERLRVLSAEIAALVAELYAFAADPTRLAGTPRVVQAWGRRAG